MNFMHYGEPQYWEMRYQDEMQNSTTGFETFDWFVSFKTIYRIFENIVSDRAKNNVLVVGVGKSDVVEVLYKKGFRQIVAVDVSLTLINQLRSQYKDYVGVEWYVMDVRELSLLKDRTFSIIIDKGCFDSFFCGADFDDSSKKYCKEMYRLLGPEGILCLFSHAPMPARIPYLRAVSWAIDTVEITEGDGMTLYILTRTTNEERIARKFAGADLVDPNEVDLGGVVSTVDQTISKVSTTKNAQNTGSVTVTASLEVLEKMIADNERQSGGK